MYTELLGLIASVKHPYLKAFGELFVEIRILKNSSSFIPQRRACITDLWADCWSIRFL